MGKTKNTVFEILIKPIKPQPHMENVNFFTCAGFFNSLFNQKRISYGKKCFAKKKTELQNKGHYYICLEESQPSYFFYTPMVSKI